MGRGKERRNSGFRQIYIRPAPLQPSLTGQRPFLRISRFSQTEQSAQLWEIPHSSWWRRRPTRRRRLWPHEDCCQHTTHHSRNAKAPDRGPAHSRYSKSLGRGPASTGERLLRRQPTPKARCSYTRPAWSTPHNIAPRCEGSGLASAGFPQTLQRHPVNTHAKRGADKRDLHEVRLGLAKSRGTAIVGHPFQTAAPSRRPQRILGWWIARGARS
jgi:hypothetical protein